MVHPVPVPVLENIDMVRSVIEGINNQNLILLSRGKAISWVPNINGINQFPKPPIIAGITIKKIIMKAWAVTTVL